MLSKTCEYCGDGPFLSLALHKKVCPYDERWMTEDHAIVIANALLQEMGLILDVSAVSHRHAIKSMIEADKKYTQCDRKRKGAEK